VPLSPPYVLREIHNHLCPFALKNSLATIKASVHRLHIHTLTPLPANTPLQARDLNLSESTRQDGASRFQFQKLTTAQTLARATESVVRQHLIFLVPSGDAPLACAPLTLPILLDPQHVRR